MPIDLPNLDDRRYSDLMEEALRLIPAHAPEWTNHNPSDPGITLVELFAYLTEMLVYRLNRVTPDHILAFLKLINGPDWNPFYPEIGTEAWSKLGPLDRYKKIGTWWQESPAEQRSQTVGETVRQLRKPVRAVSTADFEALAREADKRVARVHCIPGKIDGHLRVIVVPGPFSTPLTPKQAVGQKGEVVTVQFTVKGSAWNSSGTGYNELYSEGSWNHPDNFFVRIPQQVRDQFMALGTAYSSSRYMGKVIQVMGKLEFLHFSKGDFPVIVVEDLEHLNIAFEVPDKLKTKIEGTLRKSCLLTTQVDVEGPKLARVSVQFALVLEADALEQDARNQVERAVREFLDPLKWPFGQPIYVSRLIELFANLPGIREVCDIKLSVPPARTPVTDVLTIDPDALVIAEDPIDIKITRVWT
jgi:hypothetical protein